MRLLQRRLLSAPCGGAFAAVHGRTTAYRRISSALIESHGRFMTTHLSTDSLLPAAPLRTEIQPHQVLLRSCFAPVRSFSSQSRLYQGPRPEEVKEHSAKNSSDAGQDGLPKEEHKQSEDQAKTEGNEKTGEQNEQKEKKDEAPPPPPHGDKTPWQVFTETLRSEFKASKEWNESTKALASGVEDFTQNENVKRAKSAYTKVTDTATSTTAAALKTTGKAIGQGAAWTWETPVVKGVRKSVNAAGRGLEKVTRPVRQTEAYKNVKEVIDDGSSSRYGGWVEKEERRKKRELRELNELQRAGGRSPTEKMEEDPKSVNTVNSLWMCC